MRTAFRHFIGPSMPRLTPRSSARPWPELRTLIHQSAWKEDSRKFVCRMLDTGNSNLPCGSESRQFRPARPGILIRRWMDIRRSA